MKNKMVVNLNLLGIEGYLRLLYWVGFIRVMVFFVLLLNDSNLRVY